MSLQECTFGRAVSWPVHCDAAKTGSGVLNSVFKINVFISVDEVTWWNWVVCCYHKVCFWPSGPNRMSLVGKIYSFPRIFFLLQITSSDFAVRISTNRNLHFQFARLYTSRAINSRKIQQTILQPAAQRKPFRSRGVKRLIIFNEPIRGAPLWVPAHKNVHYELCCQRACRLDRQIRPICDRVLT